MDQTKSIKLQKKRLESAEERRARLDKNNEKASSASNYPHSSVILRKLGLKYGIRKSSSKYGKVGIN